MRNIKINQSNFYKIFLIIEIIMILISMNLSFNKSFYYFFLPTLLLINNLYLLIRSYNNTVLFFIFIGILYFNYSICMGFYYQQLPVYYHLYKIIDEKTWMLSITVITCFISTIALFMKKGNQKYFFLKCKNSHLYYLSLIYVLFISIISLFSKSYLIQKLNEYCIIFGILGFFSSNSKNKSLILSLVMLIPIISNLLLFGRAVALQLIFILLCLFVINRLKKRHILFGCIIGILVMVYFGLVGDVETFHGVTIHSFVSIFKTKMLTSDTAVYAYYCSTTFMDAMRNIYSVSFRLTHSFYSFIWYFLGGEVMKNIPSYMYSLQELTSLNYTHWNGGILPFYFMFWFGPLGVLFIGWLTSMIINNGLIQVKSPLWSIIGIYFSVSYMRWYLYLPYLRGCILILEILIIFSIFEKLLFKYNYNKVLKEKVPRKYIWTK